MAPSRRRKAEPAPMLLQAEANTSSQLSTAANAALTALAAQLQLSDGRSWATPSNLTLSRAALRVERAKASCDAFAPWAVLAPLGSAREAEELRRQLETAPGRADWKNWNFDETIDCLAYEPVIPADRFGIGVRRSGRRKGEGIIVGKRAVDVAAADGVRCVNYCLTLDMVYVIPSARGEGLGKALSAGVDLLIQKDLTDLAARLQSLDSKAIVAVVLAGDPYSPEGLKTLHGLSNAAEIRARQAFGRRIECQRDFPHHVLEPGSWW